MPEASAKVHVTKLAAAQRQLRAAVRMFFGGEDELAVHTVAAAAYRLLTDLKTNRGRDEVGDFYLTSIFYCVRDFRRGTLPDYLTKNPDTMAWHYCARPDELEIMRKSGPQRERPAPDPGMQAAVLR